MIRTDKAIILLSIIILGLITSCTILNPEELITEKPSTSAVLTFIPDAKSTETLGSTPTKSIIITSETASIPTSTQELDNISTKNFHDWIVYSEVIYDTVIISRVDGKGQRIIYEELCYPEEFSWSPNGEWIAFTNQVVCGKSDTQIYLIRPDGSEIQRLTYSEGSKYNPEWSPDGKYLSYLQVTGPVGDYTFDLYRYDFEKSRIYQITHTENVYEGSHKYSPDGKKIALTVDGDLLLMNSGGTDLTEIFESSLHVEFIDWSPRGNKIVFTASEGSPFSCADLYWFDLKSKEVQKIVDSAGHITQPVWSKEGDRIWYTRDKCVNGEPSFSSEKQIYSVRSDGSGVNPHPIFTGELFDISPLPPLEINQEYSLTHFGSNLRLRSEPSLSGSTIEWVVVEDEILVLDGPEEYDGYLWWYVEIVRESKTGWIAEIPGYFEDSEVSIDEK